MPSLTMIRRIYSTRRDVFYVIINGFESVDVLSPIAKGFKNHKGEKVHLILFENVASWP